VNRTPQCPFQDRCPRVLDVCRREDPPIEEVGPGHQVACFNQVPVAAAASREAAG
jgi:peptide/nickel transport system ATP-binding protein